MTCKNLREVVATRKHGDVSIPIHRCHALGHCTAEDAGIILPSGPMPFCHDECSGYAPLEVVRKPRVLTVCQMGRVRSVACRDILNARGCDAVAIGRETSSDDGCRKHAEWADIIVVIDKSIVAGKPEVFPPEKTITLEIGNDIWWNPIHPNLIEVARKNLEPHMPRILSAGKASAAARRSNGKLAYFTGSNRQGERPMIEAMIRSARAAGVPEDIHVFHIEDCAGGINHRIDRSFNWKNHMGKLDLLLEMEAVDAQWVTWLDTDTFFVRDPGDLSDLIRQNPCWVLMEGEIEKSVHGDWWSMRLDGPKEQPRTGPLIEFMRKYRPTGTLWTSNGGFWICRKSFIREFYRLTNAVFADWVAQPASSRKDPNRPDQADEPPLAIVGQTAVPDPENNTFEKCKHVWGIEWANQWKDRGRLPDGTSWESKDWTTQTSQGQVNPAIIHMMRGKHMMSAPVVREPVGTKLAEILKECGIQQASNCSCKPFQAQMDSWGVEGCQTNRQGILDHLASQASGISWGDVARLAVKGYFSSETLLDEAIRRAGG